MIWQELRGSALRLLATGLAPSPRAASARSKHWPSIRVALEGLGLSGNAVAGCKQFLLQVRRLTVWHTLFFLQMHPLSIWLDISSFAITFPSHWWSLKPLGIRTDTSSVE